MPNTKSAERRTRSNKRRHDANQRTKTRLKTLEKNYLALAKSGKKPEATAALRTIESALDKAAKTGVIHKNLASRKKSRLTVRLPAGT